MSAVVILFPKKSSVPRPVEVTSLTRSGWWLVTWRGCSWLHTTKDEAMTNAHAIAASHGVPVLAFGEPA
jgi:hypothetical protein